MKKKLVLASSACLVASAMALSGCSGSSKPAETSAAAEKSEAAADTTTAAAESGSSDTMHLSFYYPVNVGGDAAKLIEKICADFNKDPDCYPGRHTSRCICKPCYPAFHHGLHRYGNAFR